MARKMRTAIVQQKCLLCGELLSAKNLADGEGITVNDGVEGQIGAICLYHLTRSNPTLPARLGVAILTLVADMVDIRKSSWGRDHWHAENGCCDPEKKE